MNAAAALPGLGLLVIATCTGPDLRPVRGDHPSVRELSAAAPMGAEVEWGDVGAFDVRASDGAVAVFDRFAASVVVLDAEGERLRFGRRGEGPGELTGEGPLVFRDDGIAVFAGGRTTVFDPRGSLVGTAPSPSTRAAFEWDSATVASVGRDFAAGGLGWRVLLWDPRLSHAPDTLFRTHELVGIAPDSIGSGGAMHGRAGVGFFAGPRADTSALVRIDPVTRHVTRWPSVPRDRAPWTKEEWNRYLREGVSEGLYSATSQPMREMFAGLLSRPPRDPPESLKRLIPYEGAVGLDRASRVWVMMHVPFDQRTTIDVFDAAGHRLATLRAPGRPYERIVVKDRWLVGLSFDALDRPQIWRHDLTEVLVWLDGLES